MHREATTSSSSQDLYVPLLVPMRPSDRFRYAPRRIADLHPAAEPRLAAASSPAAVAAVVLHSHACQRSCCQAPTTEEERDPPRASGPTPTRPPRQHMQDVEAPLCVQSTESAERSCTEQGAETRAAPSGRRTGRPRSSPLVKDMRSPLIRPHVSRPARGRSIHHQPAASKTKDSGK